MNLNHSDLPMEEASVPKTEAVPELEDMISNPNQAPENAHILSS